jgi:hypothetical protein
MFLRELKRKIAVEEEVYFISTREDCGTPNKHQLINLRKFLFNKSG